MLLLRERDPGETGLAHEGVAVAPERRVPTLEGALVRREADRVLQAANDDRIHGACPLIPERVLEQGDGQARRRITPVCSRNDFVHVVAGVVRVVAQSDLKYRVHAMGTTLEGELDEILALLRRCHAEVRKHSDRALIELSIDDRAGEEGELVRSLEHLRQLSIGAPLERLTKTR